MRVFVFCLRTFVRYILLHKIDAKNLKIIANGMREKLMSDNFAVLTSMGCCVQTYHCNHMRLHTSLLLYTNNVSTLVDRNYRLRFTFWRLSCVNGHLHLTHRRVSIRHVVTHQCIDHTMQHTTQKELTTYRTCFMSYAILAQLLDLIQTRLFTILLT